MISIKKLTKHIFAESLFEEVSFILNRKDKIGLVGPNGSGKSTLLKIIVGEVESDSGEIKIEKENIGYLPQQIKFQENETIEEFLSIVENHGIETALKEVGISHISASMKVSKLSGGQKTRLALAKLLLSRPSFLLFG